MRNHTSELSKLFSLRSVSAAAITAAMALPMGAAAQSSSEIIDNADGTSEVIVTVERRAQSLQDYAGTAAAISGEELKMLGITDVTDIDGKIPGLSIANNQGNVEVYIRGVGSSNNTELGDPAAATHLNDVYLPRPAGVGAGFFDIERVEVNIGPQGTLRGRNATAGSVNIIPWKPWLGNWDAMAEVGIGNFNERSIEGMVNIPIGQTAAIRVAGYKSEHDSYLQSITPCSDELGLNVPTCEAEGVGVGEAADDSGIRVTALWEPTDRLSLTLTADQLKQQGSGYTGVNYANALGNGIRPESIKDPRKVVGRAFTPEEDTEHSGIKLHAEYDFDTFSVEYIGSKRDLLFDYDFVTPASVAYDGVLDNISAGDIDNFSRIQFLTDSESTIHEVRAFSNDDKKLSWTLGAFVFEEDQRTLLATTGDRNPFFSGIEFNQFTDTESWSVYGDATYDVTDRFRVSGGLRYTEDQKERFGVNARFGQAFIIGGDFFGCCFATGVGTEGFEFAGFDRTIFNADTNDDGAFSAQEVIDFYFDGVGRFGARDGLDDIYANGEVVDPIPFGDRPPCPELLIGFDGTSGNSCFTQATATNFGGGDFDNLVGNVSFAVVATDNFDAAIQNGALKQDFVDWRIRGEFDVSDDHLVYGLVATGSKSGGFNDNIPGIAPSDGSFNLAGGASTEFTPLGPAPTYDQERLTLYEIGSKQEFEFETLPITFNASAFYYDYNDIQLTTLLSTAQVRDFIGAEPVDGGGGTVVAFNFNASDAEIYGAQFETGVEFPGNVNFDATFLWLKEARVVDSQEIQDARYQADVDAVNAVNRSIEGNRLIRTPEFQLNGKLSKAWDFTNAGMFDAQVSFGYRSEQNMTIFNGIDYNPDDDVAARLDDEVEPYWTFDLGAGYTFDDEGKYRVEGWVANVTDEQREQGIIITQFDNTRFFSRPRTYGIRLRAKL